MPSAKVTGQPGGAFCCAACTQRGTGSMPGDLEAEAGSELNGVLAFAAPGVYRHRAGRKPHVRHVAKQRVRTRGAERPLQFLVELLLDQVGTVQG